jgi:hypothetical protein
MYATAALQICELPEPKKNRVRSLHRHGHALMVPIARISVDSR